MNFPLTDLPVLSNTSRDFVNNAEKLHDIIAPEHPYHSIEKAIELKADFPHRETLKKALLSQYESIWGANPHDEKVRENILSLQENNTYTVTTGQQLHLFIGPAFVIYKILAVIAKADELSARFPDRKFIPVYWMASEDHDFDEIKNTRLFGKDYPWQTDQSGACGRFNTSGINLLIDEMRTAINLSPENLEILAFFEKTYKEQQSLAKATAASIHHFFGDRGLVCIDGDDPQLKGLIRNMIRKDVIETGNKFEFDRLSEKLSSKSYHLQLGVRDINFFYLDEGIRKRIIRENDSFQIHESNLSFSEDQMLKLIEEEPFKFSPNAMMRPLYQESILPNVVYIGGNAEVNYWIQLSSVMDKNEVKPPMLMLRPSVWVLPAKLSEKINKSGLNELNLMLSRNDSEIIEKQGNNILRLESDKSAFNDLRNKLQSTAAQYSSPDLKALVETAKTYEKMIRNLEAYIVDEQIKKHKNELEKLLQIRDTYLNLNQIQERVTSSLEMLIKYGYRIVNPPLKGEFAQTIGIFLNL